MSRFVLSRRSRFTIAMAALVAVVVLALPAAVCAKTWYVSTKGNDATGTGTSSKPFLTVQAAVDTATAGDVVSVGRGIFSGDITMKDGVSLQGAGAEETTLTATDTSPAVYASSIGTGTNISGVTVSGSSSYGIYCYFSSPTIASDTITGSGLYGIYCFNSSPTITNDTITGNIDYGIRCYSASSPSITNCIITGHGGIADAGISCSNASSPTIASDTITGNTDGIDCLASAPAISNVTLTGNSWYGIYCFECSPTITNCVIAGNTITGIGSNSASPTVTNDTITGNGQYGIACGHAGNSSSPTIANCIVWGDTTGDLYQCSATYSDFSGGSGSGNISAAPSFVNTVTGDFHLHTGSPCIDDATSTAAPAADKDGIPRPQGSGFDMGAYEYHITKSTTTRLVAPTSIKLKASLKLSGTVASSAAPGKVTITLTRKVGSTWTSAGTATVTLTKGRFSYSFKPSHKGSWHIVATYAGYAGGKNSTVYTSSKSTTKTVTVK